MSVPSHLRFAVVAGFAALAVAYAQAPGASPSVSQPSTAPGPGTGTPGRPDRPVNPIPDNSRQPNLSDLNAQRPIMLSGKVMMAEGTVPPESVVIERVCNGVVKPEGYTDSKGRFSFQLGQNQGMFADASVGSDPTDFGTGSRQSGFGMPRGISERDLMGCEIRASLAGFTSTVVQLGGRRSLDNPDVGMLILQRMAKVDGFTFSATTAMAPKEAVKAFEKGKNSSKKNKLEDAATNLQKSVEIYPKFAAAWSELGNVYLKQGKVEEARSAFGESIKADSKFINPYMALARIAASEQKWSDAAEYSSTLIRLNPFVSGDVYFVSGAAHLNLRRLDVAEEHTRTALRLDDRRANPRLYHLLGVILSQKNDVQGAMENLRMYLKLAPDAPNAAATRKELANIEQFLSAKQQGAGASTTAPAPAAK